MTAAAVGTFGVGFLFHTSPSPSILSKFQPRYFLALCFYFGVLLPGAYLLARFVGTTHTIRRSFGTEIKIRPWQKLKVLFVFSLIGYIAVHHWLTYVLNSAILTQNSDVFHPYLQNVPRPGDEVAGINDWGFRGEPIEKQKREGTFRIFVFGGSTVFCESVSFEETHCRILERELRARYPHQKIEVQNLGAEWHSSQHSVMKLLFTAAEFQPDLVIIYHGINDMVTSLTPNTFSRGKFRGDYGHFYGAIANMRQPGRIGRFLLQSAGGHWFSDFRLHAVRINGPYGGGLNGIQVLMFPRATPAEVEWKSISSFERNLRDFVQIARSKGIKAVMASQPHIFRRDLGPREREVLLFAIAQQMDDGRMASLESMIQGFDLFNGTARQVAEENGIPFLDLESAVPKTLDFFYDDVHYTPQGNERIGNAMANFIEELGVVGSGPD